MPRRYKLLGIWEEKYKDTFVLHSFLIKTDLRGSYFTKTVSLTGDSILFLISVNIHVVLFSMIFRELKMTEQRNGIINGSFSNDMISEQKRRGESFYLLP